jgi:sugar (pentulose or hexulose) kinase
LPDLLAYLLGAKPFWEATEASTTQMVGLDGCWSRPILDSLGIGQIADQPQLPGGAPEELPGCGGRALLAHVGSHDTASAVFGLGLERPDQVFLSVGTWSLVGCVVDEPIATPEAEAANLTNERTVDGRIRLLANVPGFYVVNRLHEELGIARSVPDWLATATPEKAPRVDLTCPDLFNPVSMKDTLLGLCERGPKDEREWAGLALGSMADCVAAHVQILECVTGRRFAEIRAGGGGCQSAAFCSTLASATGMKVVTGPVEATVLGNLAMQFVSRGVLADLDEAGKVLRATAELS